MIRSLIVSGGVDPNGEAMRYKAAADRHGGARIRAVAASSHTFKRMPIDIRLGGNGGAVERLWDDADVIHLNNRVGPYDRFDRGRRKPVLLHHHGSAFRTDPAPLLARAARAGWRQAASTLDLVEIAPDKITWLPSPFDLDQLATLRREHRRPDDGLVRIAHAPTFRTLKSTATVVAVVDGLAAEGLPVELDLIEGVSWAQCLRRKAAADLVIDQLLLGYGCNAIEAWGMGLPVIAGIDPAGASAVNHPIPDSTRDRMLAEFGGSLPFVEATAGSLGDLLRTMIASPDLRTEWALRGMEHAARFHAEQPALERLLAIYGDIARPRRSRKRTAGSAVEAVA